MANPSTEMLRLNPVVKEALRQQAEKDLAMLVPPPAVLAPVCEDHTDAQLWMSQSYDSAAAALAAFPPPPPSPRPPPRSSSLHTKKSKFYMDASDDSPPTGKRSLSTTAAPDLGKRRGCQ